MQPLLGGLAHSNAYAITFLPFEKKYRNATVRSFAEWKVIAGVIKESCCVGEIIFMDVDPYLLLLATKRFRKYKLSVSGILFQPYIHFVHIRGGFSFFVKKILRNFLFQKIPVSANHNIRKLFILNDQTAVNVMNRRLKDVFHFLPDPIEYTSVTIDDKLRQNVIRKYRLDAGKKNILLFGCIDNRKNLINIIDSLRLLSSKDRSSVHFVIAGPFNADIREKYIGYIEKHREVLDIFYNDDFVAGEEREILFQSSDLVVMPYVNFYSSSNVLGHAIRHKKKVLASNTGIVGNLVKEYNIGLTVDPHNPAAIKTAVSELLFEPQRLIYDSDRLKDIFSTAGFSRSILSR
jgi:glycosyltransferase involved in cell wall biosynthesis